MKSVRERILSWARNREPDFIIGGAERPYLKRHWLLPRNPLFNIYIHQFVRSDDDRALHDHPWLFNCSILLEGRYIEWTPWKGDAMRALPDFLYQGTVKFRWGRAPHRVELYGYGLKEEPCWTVFITGPRVRQWGFYCDRGWVHWKKFTAPGDKGAIGKGCET